MGTVTIRNLPDDVINRIKDVAVQKGHSMEQEVRNLLQNKYASRKEILERVQSHWDVLPTVSPDELQDWRKTGRK